MIKIFFLISPRICDFSRFFRSYTDLKCNPVLHKDPTLYMMSMTHELFINGQARKILTTNKSLANGHVVKEVSKM